MCSILQSSVEMRKYLKRLLYRLLGISEHTIFQLGQTNLQDSVHLHNSLPPSILWEHWLGNQRKPTPFGIIFPPRRLQEPCSGWCWQSTGGDIKIKQYYHPCFCSQRDMGNIHYQISVETPEQEMTVLIRRELKDPQASEAVRLTVPLSKLPVRGQTMSFLVGDTEPTAISSCFVNQ